MATTERPLSTEERSSLRALRDAIERRVAEAIANDQRTTRSAALALVAIAAFFAAVVGELNQYLRDWIAGREGDALDKPL